ncbi:MAG: hypothetical protein DRG78_01850 [Epsilonproteobacteria bacterium]|nr:MAG: hypothetical protein DRG78_01850 [Campylobacterota bacterium]
MGLFTSIFGTKYSSKDLIKRYKSQDKNQKYEFLTFSLLECSNNNIASKDFLEIFTNSYDSLKNDNRLSKEELWIFLNLGILLNLEEMNIVDFMVEQKMQLPKLESIYSIFIRYTRDEREVISSISASMWNLKVNIFNNEHRLSTSDDADAMFFKFPEKMRETWSNYNRELYQKII